MENIEDDMNNQKRRVNNAARSIRPKGRDVEITITYCDDIVSEDGTRKTVDIEVPESEMRYSDWGPTLPNGDRFRIRAPKDDPFWDLSRGHGADANGKKG